jgi:uncharacterized phage protein (TIGR02218 family)
MPSTQQLESSGFSGQPIQLYSFSRVRGDDTTYWLYNTSDTDLKFFDKVYEAVAISDEGVSLTGEAASAELKLHLPATAQFCDDFRAAGAPPSDTIFLHVFRCHVSNITGMEDDIPIVSEGLLSWVGTVDGLTQTNDVDVQVTCSMFAASFKRGGLRYTWMKNCPHVLYMPLTCKVDPMLFRIDAVAETAHGNLVNAPEFASKPDGWLDGGYIEYSLPSGFIERRMVTRHIGAGVRLLGPAFGIVPGDAIAAYAGCARTVAACTDKFNNFPNYGGFPHLPGRNPYDGPPVF